MKEKFFVYFYYNDNGELLYIGKAIDAGKRWCGHNEPWKKDVHKIGLIQCPDHAAMDILEMYYITKIPSKYNKAGLEHGYTSFTIKGLPSPTMYSLLEFKEKFVKRAETKGFTTIEVRLVAAGIEIIDVESEVNLFDEELLAKDLDKVCFRRKNTYLISNHSQIPGHTVFKNKHNAERRTNEVIIAFKDYFSIKEKTVSLSDSGNPIYTFSFDAKKAKQVETTLSTLLNAATLYKFYEAKPHGGKECFSPSLLKIGGRAIVTSIKTKHKKGSDKMIADVTWNKNAFVDSDLHISEKGFIYSFGS